MKKTINVPLDNNITFKFVGEFISKSDEWIHMHRELKEYELIIVTKGVLYIADETHKYSVKKDEYIIMSRGLQYGYAPSSCKFFWLHFDFKDDYTPSFEIATQGTINSRDRFKSLFSTIVDNDITYRDDITNRLFCTAILREIFNQNNTTIIKSDSQSVIYHRIKDYVKWNRSYNLRVKDIADYLGYNPKYLTTLFRKFSGMTLKQYLTNQTIELAKQELSTTDRPIQAVALGLGFCDSQAFSYAFHKITGMTPTAYRNSHLPVPKNSD